MHLNGVNGHTKSSRELKAGVYAPIPTFFHPETEDLDLPPFEEHVIRLAQTGLYPVIAGSMGEAHHLSHAERKTLITTARKVLDAAGLERVPIIAGTGAGSTRETIELSRQAAEAGADVAIVIASGYFAGVLNTECLRKFFVDVAEASPIPVMIYNFPGASSGLDLDSDLITELAALPNVCGVKLTCGSVGKLTRIANVVSEPSFKKLHPRLNANAPFLTLGGFVDFLVPSAFANADGCITGTGNVAPHAVSTLFNLAERARTDPSLLPEALKIQGIVARADYTLAKTNCVPNTKYLLEKIHGYSGCYPRRPMIRDEAVAVAMWEHPHIKALLVLERSLSGKP